MTMTQVLYALAVEKHLNFSAAAKSLFVSQPALSLQIKTLETELGCRLFERTTHGVAVTKRGREFCEAARPLSRAWDEFQTAVRGEAKKTV